MATLEIRRPGKVARAAHSVLLFSAALLLLTLTVCIVRLYPLAHTGLLKADALLDESARTVIDAKKLIREGQQAETLQIAYLNEWDGKVSLTLDNANGVLASLRRTSDHLAADEDAVTLAGVGALRSTDRTVAGLQPLTKSLQASVDDLGSAAVQLEKLESDPNIPRALAATASAAENVSGTAANLDATTADVKTAVHAYLHPTWATRIVNWAAQAVHSLGGWL